MIRKGDHVIVEGNGTMLCGNATKPCPDPFMGTITILEEETGELLNIRGDLADFIEVNGESLDEFSDAYAQSALLHCGM